MRRLLLPIAALALSPLLVAGSCDFATEPSKTYDFTVFLVNRSPWKAEFTAGEARDPSRWKWPSYHIESGYRGRLTFYDKEPGFDGVTVLARPVDIYRRNQETTCRFPDKTRDLFVVYNGETLSCQGN